MLKIYVYINRYEGEWAVEQALKNPLAGDLGLVLKSKAKHSAVSARLKKPFKFEHENLIVQYEINFQVRSMISRLIRIAMALTFDPLRIQINQEINGVSAGRSRLRWRLPEAAQPVQQFGSEQVRRQGQQGQQLHLLTAIKICQNS